MTPRFFVDTPAAGPFQTGDTFALPSGPARHVQVLRLQPGGAITLFDGTGGEWSATVSSMGRSDVTVQIGAHDPVDREVPVRVTLALGMPANERMDTVIEKATELGVSVIQPLHCERSVLRLNSERAARKVAHWQGVAIAACEQSGRTRVPVIAPVRNLVDWLREPVVEGSTRWMLSFRDAYPIEAVMPASPRVLCLSGPEGGLSAAEEAAARSVGFAAISLGALVLRADTAPIAVMAHLALSRFA